MGISVELASAPDQRGFRCCERPPVVAECQAERSKLTALLNGGKHSARKLKRAQILLAADAGTSDEDIAISVGVGGS